MKQRLHKGSSRFEFHSHGITYNKVVMCQFKETLTELEETFISIYEYIRDINFKYYHSREVLKEQSFEFKVEIDSAIKYCSLTSSLEFRMRFEQLVVKQQKPVVQSYKKAFMHVMNKYKPCKNLSGCDLTDEQICQQNMMYFFEISIILLERYIIKKILNKVQGSFVLVFDDFKQEYMYDISKNIEGIISKRFTKEEQIDYRFLQLFDIPVIRSGARLKNNDYVALSTYNQLLMINPDKQSLDVFEKNIAQVKHKDIEQFNFDKGKIKLFAPIVDDRFLDKINRTKYYDGICPYRTEYEYKTYGMVPDDETILQKYNQIMNLIMNSDKEFMIRLPDLRPEKEIEYLQDLTTDLDNLNKYPGIFYKAIENIAKVFGDHKNLVLVLPMIMAATEVNDWSRVIKEIFTEHKKPMPKIAIMISTEAAYDYIEDYAECNIDLVIVGLNDLFEEILEINRHQEISIDQFLEDCKFHVQNIHQTLRQMKLRHIFMGNILKNVEILHKFIKMGCQEFCIPIEHSGASFNLVEEYSKGKGKYIGTYHRQIELTALRRKILEETGRKPKNRYPKNRKNGKIKH
jgi:hypothetical protein